MKLIKINGKLYHQLGMHDGHASVGELFDVNNEVVDRLFIWGNQTFFDSEINPHIKSFVYIVRYFKKDVYGRSKFKEDIGLC